MKLESEGSFHVVLGLKVHLEAEQCIPHSVQEKKC